MPLVRYLEVEGDYLKNHSPQEKNIRHKVRLFIYMLGLLLVLSLIASPPYVYGQDSPILASLNASEFTTDDLVILTVSVVDDSPQQPRPILPPLDGLAVIDFDIATNVSMVHGKIQTEVVYTYQLQPRRTGVLVIPPVTVEIDDQTFAAPPLSITVSPGSPPVPSPGNAAPVPNIAPPLDIEGQDFFVESAVDLATPYVGQQVVYTFRFYQAIKLYQPPQHEMPIFAGLDTIGLPVQQYNLAIGSRTYLVTEIRMALFPKTAGNIRIGPAQLVLPGNYFEEPVEFYTGPATLQVKALPDNAPAGFNGAVGQYQIEAWYSPQIAVVNQPGTFSVAVSGTGNINTLPEPIWPNLSGWRPYDSQTNATIEMRDGRMVGTRIYERLIMSDKVGDFIIPPTKLVYFDPSLGEYQTISTKSLSGRIIPAPTPDPAAATAAALAAIPTATPVSIANSFSTPSFGSQPVNPTFLGSSESPWRVILPMGIVLFWAICGAIPVAVVAGAGGYWLWQKRQQQLEAEAETLQLPSQKTHPALAKALAGSSDNYKAVSRALHTYLGEVLGTPTKGLTQTDLANRLQQRGLAKSLINRIKDCLAESEMGRFGPGLDDAGWGLLTKTEELLFELDEALKQ